MNFRTLRNFVVLAEELNFSRAAERLRIAQPALSQQIQNLERAMGAQLVDRRHRPLRLTEAGNYLLTEARGILESYEQAALSTREIGLGSRGWLGIGFTRSSMYSVLPPALKEFHQAYPRVELKLFEMLTEDHPDALRDGRIHIGIGRQPSPVAGCTTRLLRRERVLAVLAPDHPAAAEERVSLDRLANSPLILYPAPTGAFGRMIESMYRDAGLVPRVEHRTFEIQTAIALVAAGLGVTFVGASVAGNGRRDVVYRHLDGPGPDSAGARTTSLAALYQDEDNSPQLHRFLEFLPTAL
jgi:DNA-binding transcriptional LysR family regulator